MRYLSKPTISAEIVFTSCVGVVQSSTLRQKFINCSPLITQAETEFEQKNIDGTVHTIQREKLVNGNVDFSEFVKLYTGRMVGNSVGRVYYDMLILAAKNGLCPLCSHRDVSTLDHYLPKTLYPRLAVVPLNLIPACKDCNTGKLSSYPTSPQTQTLHPYFDNIENDEWLKVIVNKTNPISVSYFVERATGWSDLLYDRVQEHFKSFGLKVLYATQAGRELAGIKHQLQNSFNHLGTQGVQNLLVESATSRAMESRNSWQSALYLGLSNDYWFCSSGFNQIA
jgi:5-methylcytosine-specific restriction endonuclease McrA